MIGKILSKNTYVFMLDEEQKGEVRSKLEKALTELGYKDCELNEIIENGMNSRVCDLENTINTYG